MDEFIHTGMKAIAKKIDDCIKEKKISRQEFAATMGVQPSNVTKWLSGNHNFTLSTLLAIEYKLGIPLLVTSENEIEKVKQQRFYEWLNKAYIAIEELKKYTQHP